MISRLLLRTSLIALVSAVSALPAAAHFQRSFPRRMSCPRVAKVTLDMVFTHRSRVGRDGDEAPVEIGVLVGATKPIWPTSWSKRPGTGWRPGSFPTTSRARCRDLLRNAAALLGTGLKANISSTIRRSWWTAMPPVRAGTRWSVSGRDPAADASDGALGRECLFRRGHQGGKPAPLPRSKSSSSTRLASRPRTTPISPRLSRQMPMAPSPMPCLGRLVGLCRPSRG